MYHEKGKKTAWSFVLQKWKSKIKEKPTYKNTVRKNLVLEDTWKVVKII